MFKTIIIGLVLCVCFYDVTAKYIPSFIVPCSISKNFDKCFIKHANLAIPEVIKGDRKLRVPPFNPAHLDAINYELSKSLKIIFKNIDIFGLDEAKVTAAHLDEKNNIVTFTLNIPNFVTKGDYIANGRILVLPFDGKGPFQMKLVNANFFYKLVFSKIDFNSDEKATLSEVSVDYTVDKTTYKFENLFNGNKQLGDELNKFMNDNHAELHKDLGAVFKTTLHEMTNDLFKNVIENFTYKDIFLP